MNGLSIVPALNVEFDGNALTRGVLGTLEEFTLRHELSQPSLCELSFVPPARDFLPRPGAQTTVTLGQDEKEIFTGEIAAVEYVRRPSGECAVLVRAYDKLQDLRKRHTLRAYTQMSAANL